MSSALQQVSADSVRAALEQIFAAPEYQWDIPRDLLAAVRRFLWGILDWLQALRSAHPVAYWVVLIVMMAVLVGIFVHFGYLIWRALRPRLALEHRQPAAAGVRRDAAWHVREARRLAEAGRYTEALAHRFTALVMDLDRRDALQYHPSKTPNEYLAEVQMDAQGQGAFAELVAALYRHLFGGVPSTADDVLNFDRRAGEMRTHVASA